MLRPQSFWRGFESHRSHFYFAITSTCCLCIRAQQLPTKSLFLRDKLHMLLLNSCPPAKTSKFRAFLSITTISPHQANHHHNATPKYTYKISKWQKQSVVRRLTVGPTGRLLVNPARDSNPESPDVHWSVKPSNLLDIGLLELKWS